MCRSLPYEALLAQLSQAVGTQVGQGNLRYSLAQAFGEDASLKAQAYLGVSPPAPPSVICCGRQLASAEQYTELCLLVCEGRGRGQGGGFEGERHCRVWLYVHNYCFAAVSAAAL